MSDALTQTLEGVDERGRYFSPYILRGDDQVPYSVQIPSLEEMRELDDASLALVSQRMGWNGDITSRLEESKSFLQTFNVGPTDPSYEVQMERLAANARRQLLGRARRSAQRHETAVALGGDMNKRVIVVNESAEPCDACAPLGGVVGTYAELAANNELPWEVCEGGSLCQCTVVEYG